MKIAVIGATGMVGSRVCAEARGREYEVTAVARSGVRSEAHPLPEGLTLTQGDATDRTAMRRIFAAHDAVVATTRPAPGTEDTVPETTQALLDAARDTGRRVLVVGGAGPLRVPGDRERLVIDDPRYVADAWRAAALASVEQFRICADHAANWVYVSPPAMLVPGERTGRYRLGTDELLVAPDGTSQISAEDFAVALVDELERPNGGGRRWITVGY